VESNELDKETRQIVFDFLNGLTITKLLVEIGNKESGIKKLREKLEQKLIEKSKIQNIRKIDSTQKETPRSEILDTLMESNVLPIMKYHLDTEVEILSIADQILRGKQESLK